MIADASAARHRSSATALNDAWETVTASMARIVRKHAYLVNSRVTIARLPAELLCQAFALLDTRDRITTTHVCRHWREVALEASVLLWTHIADIRRPSTLRALLERAQGAPVDISELFVDNDSDPLFSALMGHMPHIRTLRFRFRGPVARIADSSSLGIILRSSAPILERLSILGDAAARSAVSLTAIPNMFGGFAPVLRNIQLLGTSVNADFFAQLPSAQVVRTCTVGGYRCMISYPTVETLVRALPGLHTLNIEMMYWNLLRDAPPQGLPSTLQRINLRTTTVDGLNPRGVIPEREGWNSIPSIHVAHTLMRITGPDDSPGAPCYLPQGAQDPIVMIDMRIDNSIQRIHVRTIDAAQRERAYTNIFAWHAETLLGDAVAESVTMLSIMASHKLVERIRSVNWPALRTLRIVAVSRASVESLNTITRGPISMPVLQNVEFATDSLTTESLWHDEEVELILEVLKTREGPLQQVTFLGCNPPAGLVTQSLIPKHAQRSEVQPNWKAPAGEWFQQLPFDWD